MAKKKTRKNDKEKKQNFIIMLIGLMLFLAAILGICKYGVVGKIVASFAVFLVGGNISPYFLTFVLFLGIWIFLKREKFPFFTSKMLGVYLIVTAILVKTHEKFVLNHIDEGAKKVLSITIDNIMNGIQKIMNGSVKAGFANPALENTGGGILGGFFSTAFNYLFDSNGTNIVIGVIFVAGIIVFTGFSILDFIKNAKEKMTDKLPKKTKTKDLDNTDSLPLPGLKIVDHNDHEKIVVQDLSEITKKGKEIVTDNKPEEEVIETNKNYVLPPLTLLDLPKNKKSSTDHTIIERNIVTLEKVLNDFGIIGRVVEVNIGPTVTQYEMELNSGTKVSRLLGINREISLALAKKDIRIQAPIPGKGTVGIEMPNENAQMVSLREVIELLPKSLNQSLLAVALGKDIMGKVKWCEIDTTPHLLIAGATGSGKSVCINSVIISILMKAKPNEVKLILIDPKKVELSVYNGVPHLLTPVVTDPRKASIALKKAVSEMERRYDLFEEHKCKNIYSYNKLIEERSKKYPDEELTKLPYMVVIVDELADLMLVAGKEVEDSIMRITQMARAAGIHLIIATQRPSTDVITGLIKANIPSRISFAVTNGIDSRTILDMMGAEKLLGRGDMLFIPMGAPVPDRIQGAYIGEEEIKRVVDYTADQQKASYDKNFLNLDTADQEQKEDFTPLGSEDYDDPLYNDIVEFVVTSGKASASLLQRRFKLGYNRAARIVDLLEERGIIGPQNGSKPREVLIKLDNKQEEEY